MSIPSRYFIPIALLPPTMVIRSVRRAAGLEAPIKRSLTGELIVIATAALAVPPTVSRVQAFLISSCAGLAQDASSMTSAVLTVS